MERRVWGRFDQSILYAFMKFSNNVMIFLKFPFKFYEKKMKLKL